MHYPIKKVSDAVWAEFKVVVPEAYENKLHLPKYSWKEKERGGEKGKKKYKSFHFVIEQW